MTPQEAHEAVTREPDRWRVALVESTSFPLLESPDARVTLFELKKDAEAELRKLRKQFIAAGYKLERGALSRGFLQFEQDDEMVGLGLDYPGRLT